MKFAHILVGLSLGLLMLGATAETTSPKAMAYVAWWLPDSWRSAPLHELDRVLFFELKVDANGAIKERHGWPQEWTELQSALEQHQTALDLTITLLEPAIFNSVFSSDESVQRLLDDAIALGNGAGVAGIQLDVEVYDFISPDRIVRYQKFVVDLSHRLRTLSPPRTLSVFFPMGASSQIYDVATLVHVDRVVVQGYDSHWTGSKNAGPVAPVRGPEAVTWEKGVAQALSLGVAKENIVMSFPLYGYEWPVKSVKPRGVTVGKGVTTTFAPLPLGMLDEFPLNVQSQVLQHGSVYDAASGSSSYHYKQPNGQWIEGWFEDGWALENKSRYLVSQQLGGIAFFVLGYDRGQLVNQFLKLRGPRLSK